MTTIQEPDYSAYNLKELQSAYDNINRDKYPERFERLKTELVKRRAETPPGRLLSEGLESIYPSSLRRFLAFFVDSILLGIISWIAIAITSFLPAAETVSSIGQTIIYCLYFGFYDSSKSLNPSPGKKALGIHLIDIKGYKLSYKHSLMRAGLYPLVIWIALSTHLLFVSLGGNVSSIQIVMSLITMIGIGESVFQIFHPQKRTLLDVITHTFVLRSPETQVEPAQKFVLIPTLVAGVIFSLAIWGISKIDFSQSSDPELAKMASELRSELHNEHIDLTVMKTLTSGEPLYYLKLKAKVSADQVDNELLRDQFIEKASSVLTKHIKNPAIKKVQFELIAQKYLGLVTDSYKSSADLIYDNK